MAGPLTLTPSGTVNGATVMLKIIGDGVNTPVFQNFIALDSSQGFDATSGSVNLVQGIRLYNEYYFSVTQVDAPIAVAAAYTLALQSVTSSSAILVAIPTGGIWPSGTTLTPAVAGVTGSFSPATISPSGSTPAQITFTATSAGTAALSISDNQGLSDPASVSQAFNPAAVATAYTLALTNVTASGATLVVTPTGGTWPAGTTITPSVTGITGTFSPATISPTGANTGQIAFTATASGTAVLSVADNQGLTDPASVSQAFNPSQTPGSVPLTWTTANGATITGNNVALAATGNGSIATPVIDATQPFEVIINWEPSNSTQAMVAYIASNSNASFAWPNPSGLIAGMYRFAPTAFTVPPTSSPVAIGTAAESVFMRMRKSGNDIIMDRSVDGVTYAGARTLAGALTGQTQAWLKVLAANGAANLDVNLYV
jgi:hypothetical protein